MPVKTIKLTRLLRNEYNSLFNSLEMLPAKKSEVHSVINNLTAHESRYQQVSIETRVPWYFIAIIHQLESTGNFKRHLHNGDPLDERTVQVPKGRPKNGIPPFTWEESAIDAMQLQGYRDLSCWSLTALLYRFEKYNGLGYRNRHNTPSPYLWSYSQHYKKGKYTADGKYNPDAISKQPGVAVLLKRMMLMNDDTLTAMQEPERKLKELFQVPYNPSKFNSHARELQKMLNSFGYDLNADGLAGKLTSEAVLEFSGKYLAGDPRI